MVDESRPDPKGVKPSEPITPVTVLSPPDKGAESDYESAGALVEGRIIEERYRILSHIGRGGMGSVYKVEDVEDGRVYALKTLHPENLSEMTWRRFQKEVQAAQRLDHPVLIKVHHLGLIEGRQPYCVMDYFEGKTLSEQIGANGSLPLQTALPIFIQTTFALGHAHRQGVVHRDLKPSNIMISGTDRGADVEVRIVDFGIAKVLSAEESTTLALTRTGEIFGTPFYMSPEQCLGVAIDHRSDIYSLGCVFYEVLTGTPPFLGESALSTMMKHQSETPASLKEASLGTEFPEKMEMLVARLLEKRPEDRYQNLIDVANELNQILGEGKESGSRDATKELKKTGAYTSRHARVGPVASSVSRLALYVVLLAACTILSFFLGRQSIDVSTLKNSGPDHSSEVYTTSVTGGPRDEKGWAASGYFSSWDPGAPDVRLFHFPQTDDLLRIKVQPGSRMLAIKDGKLVDWMGAATGDVIITNFRPIELDSNYSITPEVLKRFRPDDIGRLEIANDLGLVDSGLANIVHLKSIKKLNITDCHHLTDECIAFVNELPNLVELSLGNSKMDGTAVSKLKRLRRLTHLSAGRMKGADKVLAALSGSTAITYIGLRHAFVNDDDLRPVPTMPNLTVLDLSHNALTERSLKYVSGLKKLEILHIQGYPFKSSCFPYLKQLPNLKVLSINCSRWSREERREIQKDMPHCEFYIDLHTKMR